LALLNSSADRVNLPLNRADISLHRTHCSQSLIISSIIKWKQMSSL